MIYTTIAGEWMDQISYKIYGTERFANVIYRENPAYLSVSRFDAGVALKIPSIATTQTIGGLPWSKLFKS